jgi:hypothetical protein
MSATADFLHTHKRPLQLFGVVAVGDLAMAFWYAANQHIPVTSAVCYMVGVTTTSGSSVPSGTSGTARLITLLGQVLLIPLAGAVFSLVTSHITAGHVEDRMSVNHQGLHNKLDELLRWKRDGGAGGSGGSVAGVAAGAVNPAGAQARPGGQG